MAVHDHPDLQILTGLTTAVQIHLILEMLSHFLLAVKVYAFKSSPSQFLSITEHL